MAKIIYICPECGHKFVQGEWNYNEDTAMLDFECPECGWYGDETSVDERISRSYTRKYESYTLHADFGQVNEDFENYKDAYAAYCTQARYHHAATLYGRDEMGKIHVIWSRGED